MSVLHDVVRAGIEFERDAHANEKLVLKTLILDLFSVMNSNGARVFFEILGCQISACFEY